MMVRVVGLLTLLLAPLTVYAHHVGGGEAAASAMHGLLSGLGHPVIDVVHLAFMLAMGFLLAASSAKTGLGIVLFLGATLLGAFIHLTLGIPQFGGSLLALTVIGTGALVMIRAVWGRALLFAVAGVAGIVHGLAYASTILGAHIGTTVSYFIGFTLTQSVVLLIVVAASRRLITFLQKVDGPLEMRVRLAGGAGILLVGVVFL